VSVHWGENYEPVADQQRRDARVLADAGVDVVIGHHPHDVQHVQWIGRTLVLYSLGNYAWGAIGNEKLRVGLVARLTIDPRRGQVRARLREAELLPILTQNRIVKYQPRRVRWREMQWLDPMIAASRAAGVPLEVDGTRIRIPLAGAER
jgi:poly-gamma-glutamate synthesis protein (capsule biosynthesis protein)